MIIAPGSTDVTTYFKLVDPVVRHAQTGLTIADLDATYVRDRAAAVKADLTALVAVDSAHGDNKAIQIDAANAPGLYRVDWPDAAFAAGVSRVQLVVNGAAIDPAVIEVELVPWVTPITGATVLADLRSILGTVLTETVGGYLAAAFKKLFDVAAPVLTAASKDQTGDSYAALTTHDGKLDTVDANVDTLIARLTALRAGYLDNLSAGAVAQATALATHDGKLDTVDGLIDTLVARIGAFTGTGVNTVLGFLKALASKAASTPSDVGGTFSAATDSLEALQELTATRATLGAGATTWTYTLTSSVDGSPIADADVWVSTDAAGTNIVASGKTNASGVVTFWLDPGTVYVFRQRSGFDFLNPDIEVVV